VAEYTGGASREGGSASIFFSSSATARSSWGSLPAITDFGSFSASMSGSTAWPSVIQLPSTSFVPLIATNTVPQPSAGPGA